MLFFLYVQPAVAKTDISPTLSLISGAEKEFPCSKIYKQVLTKTKPQATGKNSDVFSRIEQWMKDAFMAVRTYFGIVERKPVKEVTSVQVVPCDNSTKPSVSKTDSMPTPTISPMVFITPTPTRPEIQPVRKTQIRLMPLGDSITDGTILPGGYRTELWKKLMMDGDNIDFVGSISSGSPDLGDSDHQGLIGWTIPQLDGSVGGWIAAYQPDIVLLHIGTNDLDHGATPESMTQSMSKLIGDIFAAKPDTFIIVSTLVPSTHGAGSTWSSFNASIPNIAAQYSSQGRRIIALDMSQVVTGGDLADGIHPNAIGYSKMANMWYPVVTTVYKQLSK